MSVTPLSTSEATASTNYDELINRIDTLQNRIDELEEQTPDSNSMNLMVFDSHRDRLLAAFVMATGAAACGMNVRMFFTFWGTAALKNGGPQSRGKSLVEWAFGWMLPSAAGNTKLSQMDMLGVGRRLMQSEMARKNIADIDELMETASDLGVKISVCEMSMKLMGIQREELIDYPNLEFCGAAQFVDYAARANTTLVL